jgi:RNA polymerase sigma-70 factor (ECF subfamily)
VLDPREQTPRTSMSSQAQPASDSDLLRAWRDGDRDAGALLFSRYHPSMVRFFAPKIGYEESDDLIQNTFLALREGLERFREEATVRTLLFAIARNQINYYFRRLMRDRRRFAFDSSQTSLAAIDPTPTQLLAGDQQNLLLLRALRELPFDTQMMIELHYWEQMPVRDIALVMEFPVNTVKTRLFRGRKRLEELMERLAESPAQLDTTLSDLSAWAARLRLELEPSDE